MSPLRLLLPGAIAVALVVALAPQGPSTTDRASPRPPGEAVRGITISTHGIGREWADERVMAPTLTAVRDVGAQWIAIHPYARIAGDGSVRVRGFDAARPPEHWTRPIHLAHRQGLKVLVKPHLAYWGSRFSWRGEIEFDDPAHWRRFWREYRAWIEAIASACRDADGIVIGTELDRTLHHESEWRALIAAVRARTRAPLTYAANWTDFERVPFWDATDVIGIQAYFPLTDGRDPSDAELRAAWRTRMAQLRRYADRQRRNIVFTELGYNRAHDAPIRPWRYETDGEDAAAIQATCMRLALEAIDAEDSVLGAFLWKWFPEPRPIGRNFQLATPAMRAAIRARWRTAPTSGH